MNARPYLISLFVVSFLFPFRMLAQDDAPELFPEPASEVMDEPDSSFTSFFIDAGSVLMPIRDVCVPGLALKIGGAGKNFASSLTFDLVTTDKVVFPSEFEVLRPDYKYILFGWDNEYVCNPEKRISVSFHVKAGFGYADYFDNAVKPAVISYYEIDDSSSYYTPVYEYYSGLIASDNFFSVEPGINVLCNLSDWLSVGVGWNSRIVFGINAESPMRDDVYYSGNFFLRFRITGKRAIDHSD